MPQAGGQTRPCNALGQAVLRLLPEPDPTHHVLDKDIILVWGEERRVITAADVLECLLRGVVPWKRD